MEYVEQHGSSSNLSFLRMWINFKAILPAAQLVNHKLLFLFLQEEYLLVFSILIVINMEISINKMKRNWDICLRKFKRLGILNGLLIMYEINEKLINYEENSLILNKISILYQIRLLNISL